MIEIIPPKKIDATITIPGSKYVMNRALICAALAKGTTKLLNISENDDISSARNALKQLGVKMKKEKDTLIVEGTAGEFKEAKAEIHAGNSGTLMRFITAVAALVPGTTTITGTEQLLKRPIGELVESLADVGAKISTANHDLPPVIIEEAPLFGGKTLISGKVSSQYVSALLLVAPYTRNGLEIVITEDLVSKPYIDLTIDVMKQFGVEVEREEYKRFKIKGSQHYKATDFTIPADWSSASYFLAAAALVEGKVKITNLDMTSVQGESKFINCLTAMGCKITQGKDWIKLKGPEELKAIEVDMGHMPDVVQTLAALAAYANGTTLIKNIAHLRYKECDRLTDTASELVKRGVKVETGEDYMQITGGELKAGTIQSHDDHRMAMSLALLGVKTEGIKIENPNCVAKSFPKYWKVLKEIGVGISE